jgi:hypothetical protein
MRDKFLVLKLDQYAGNVDEIVCVALTGYGYERYGADEATLVYNDKVAPILNEMGLEEAPLEFSLFETEYGLAPYSLDSASTNYLRLGIDSYMNVEAIREMIEIWNKAYGDSEGNLEITVELKGKSVTVKVLGFDFIEVSETRTSL